MSNKDKPNSALRTLNLPVSGGTLSVKLYEPYKIVESINSVNTIVFLHGFTLDYRVWEYCIERFKRDYRVIAYDMLGFGASSYPTQQYRHSVHVIELLDALQIDKAHLIGFSMGGGEALDCAVSYPERVLSVGLVAGTCHGQPWQQSWLDFHRDIANHAQQAGIEAAKQVWLGSELFKPLQNKAALIEMMNDYSGWHWVNSDPGGVVKPPLYSDLSRLTVPVLTVVGSLDLADFRNVSDTLVAQVKRVKQQIVPGHGHMLPLECSSLLHHYLANWIQQGYRSLEGAF